MLGKAKAYFAAIAVITALAVPASLLAADVPAGATTTACGGSCTSPSNQSTGTVLAVSGSSVTLATANTTSSAQDWTPEQEGSVANAVAAGVLAPKLNLLYSTDPVIELQTAPNGVPSDNCLADQFTTPLTSTQAPFFAPTLTVGTAQCGTTAATLWIVDASNEANGFTDLINAGYETAFSFGAPDNSTALNFTGQFAEPAVLTVNSSGKVVLAPLSQLGATVSPTQMWASWSAPAQAFLRTAVQTAHRKLAAKSG
jgi:hypothetical protein